MCGMIDSDGYVNFKKSMIQIVNTYLGLLKFLKESIYYFGINSTITKKAMNQTMKKTIIQSLCFS